MGPTINLSPEGQAFQKAASNMPAGNSVDDKDPLTITAAPSL
jgi:hypothetical protein